MGNTGLPMAILHSKVFFLLPEGKSPEMKKAHPVSQDELVIRSCNNQTKSLTYLIT